MNGSKNRYRMAQSGRKFNLGGSLEAKTITELRARQLSRVLRSNRVISPDETLKRLKERN